jgi:hypothetical protein
VGQPFEEDSMVDEPYQNRQKPTKKGTKRRKTAKNA